MQAGLAPPHRDDAGVEDLRAGVGRKREAGELRPHDARDRAELDPALEQLGREPGVGRVGVVAADVGAPAGRRRRAPSTGPPSRRRRARRSRTSCSGPRPRRPRRSAPPRSSPSAGSARRAGGRRSSRSRSGRSAGSGCASPRRGCRRPSARRRGVLAEVLHPAVVARAERAVGARQEGSGTPPAWRRRPVELGQRRDREAGRADPADEPGEGERLPAGVLLQRARRLRAWRRASRSSRTASGSGR